MAGTPISHATVPAMASPAQIAANRANALKSTGPRTGAGKAASRLNALRHGADARSAVLPGEDPADLEALAASYRLRLQPSTPDEHFLVDTLIQSDWLRRRYLRLEAAMTNHLIAEMEPCENPLAVLYASDTPAARSLDRVRRYYQAAERAWFRASRELDRLRERGADSILAGAFSDPLDTREPPEPENWLRSADPAPMLVSSPQPDPIARDPRLALRL